MSESFGELLRQSRRLAGMSQRKLAEAVGVDFSYVSKVENDRLPPPSADTILRIAKATGSPPEDLLAAARKIPDAVGKEVVREPAAQTFLRMASSMKLSGSEWEEMVGKLRTLRERDEESGSKR